MADIRADLAIALGMVSDLFSGQDRPPDFRDEMGRGWCWGPTIEGPDRWVSWVPTHDNNDDCA